MSAVNVRTVGGKIIAFKDYEYSPTAPRIWNLPGGFVTEEEAAKLKKLIEVDLKELEKAMDEAGAPWTPGRVPVTKQ